MLSVIGFHLILSGSTVFKTCELPYHAVVFGPSVIATFSNYTRLLMKVRNLRWKQHANLGRIYGNLPTIVSVLSPYTTQSTICRSLYEDSSPDHLYHKWPVVADYLLGMTN